MATANRQPCLVVSGPSGAGKSTLLNRLFKKYPDSFGFSISHTTRQPRSGEIPDKSYHFVERKTFDSMIDRSLFIEHAQFSGNKYGTAIESIKSIPPHLIPVLDLEIHGVKSIKSLGMTCRFLFIQPPSMDVLKERLLKRNTETAESLATRLASAQEAIDYAEQGNYDIVIVNDEQDVAYAQLEKFVEDSFQLTFRDD